MLYLGVRLSNSFIVITRSVSLSCYVITMSNRRTLVLSLGIHISYRLLEWHSYNLEFDSWLLTSIGFTCILSLSVPVAAWVQMVDVGTSPSPSPGVNGRSVFVSGVIVVGPLLFGQLGVDVSWLVGAILGGPHWNHGLAGNNECAISICVSQISWSISPSIPCRFHSCWFRQLGW